MTSVWLAGGLALCGYVGGASFAMGLLGARMAEGGPVLAVVVLTVLVKAFAMVIGPVLFIVQKQRLAFIYFAVGVATKTLVVAALAVRGSAFDIALAALAVDGLLITPMTLLCVAHCTGFRPSLAIAARTVASIAAALGGAMLLRPPGSLSCGLLAVALYMLVVVMTGQVSLRDIAALRRSRRAGAAAQEVGAQG